MIYTWRCYICKKERPEDKISVYTKPLIVNGAEFGSQNIRYCNDNNKCFEKAKTVSLVGGVMLHRGGVITKEEIEEFAERVLTCVASGWVMKWTKASPSICMKEGKSILIEERYIDTYPWAAKEIVLHETAHIFTEDKVHGAGFYKAYIKLLIDFML